MGAKTVSCAVLQAVWSFGLQYDDESVCYFRAVVQPSHPVHRVHYVETTQVSLHPVPVTPTPLLAMTDFKQKPKTQSLFGRPYFLVALGFALGYLAQAVLGPPAEQQNQLTREFKRPLPEVMPDLDLPLDGKQGVSDGVSDRNPEAAE